MHQFLASDDGRGVAGADEDTVDQNADDDGAQDEVDKSAAEAEDNDFDSEDTPDDDSFVSLKTKTSNSEQTKQKLEIRALNMMKSKDKSQSPWDGDDDDDDGDDEYEHGDVISHAKDEDASDYSMHQFLASDDGRGVAGADEDTVDTNADDDGAQDEVDKSAAEAEDNDFDSEDTPEDDSFMSVKAKTSDSAERQQKLEIRALKLMQSGRKSRSPWDGDDDDDD